MKFKSEKLVFLSLICVFGFMSVVYAMYSTTLFVVGKAEASGINKNWKIEFTNLAGPVITGSPTIVNKPTLSDTVIGEFKIKLNNPNDSVSYEFDINNKGDFDAIVSTLYKKQPICVGSGNEKLEDEMLICDNLTYTLKYKENNKDISLLDEINKKESKKVILTLSYKGEDMPKEKVDITGLNISLVYEEKK